MQTTVGIDVSSEGDAATQVREASGMAVANPDTPDGPAVPKTSGNRVSAALAKRSGRENASNDIGELAPP